MHSYAFDKVDDLICEVHVSVLLVAKLVGGSMGYMRKGNLSSRLASGSCPLTKRPASRSAVLDSRDTKATYPLLHDADIRIFSCSCQTV